MIILNSSGLILTTNNPWGLSLWVPSQENHKWQCWPMQPLFQRTCYLKIESFGKLPNNDFWKTNSETSNKTSRKSTRPMISPMQQQIRKQKSLHRSFRIKKTSLQCKESWLIWKPCLASLRSVERKKNAYQSCKKWRQIMAWIKMMPLGRCRCIRLWKMKEAVSS